MGDVTSFVRALVNSRLLALAAAQGLPGRAVFLRNIESNIAVLLLVSVLNALLPVAVCHLIRDSDVIDADQDQIDGK